MRTRNFTTILSFACIAAAAFAIGRTTAPSNATAGNAPANTQALISQEVTRQLSAFGTQYEDDIKNRFPKLIREEVIDFVNEKEAEARNNSLMSTLLTVRSMLEVFKTQHNDRYPTFAEMQNWSILTHKSSAATGIDAKGDFGPYLQQQPRNPFNGNYKIVPAGHPTADSGWTYNEKTGELLGVAPQSARGSLAPTIQKYKEIVEFVSGN